MKRKKNNKPISLFIALGSIILFASWIADNYFHKTWDEKGKQIDYYRTYLYNEAVYKDIIKEVVNHYATIQNPDTITTEAFKHSLYKYTQTLFVLDQISANMMAIDNRQYNTEWLANRLRIGDSTLAEMKKTWQYLDITTMQIKSMEMEATFYSHYGPDLLIINNYRKELFSKSEKSNSLFLILYIMGSLLLAISFLLKHYQFAEPIANDNTQIRKYIATNNAFIVRSLSNKIRRFNHKRK